MKIAKIILHNFRSIKDAVIEPSNFNVFVGQNNHGKTNLFEAIQWFYSGKGDINDIRFCHEGTLEVSVELEFSNIHKGLELMKNEKNRESIKKVVGENQTIRIKRSSSGTGRVIFDPKDNKWLEKSPTGFDKALNDFFPRFEYVDTQTSLEDVNKYGKNTPITAMLSGVLSTILESNQKYKDFRNKFEDLFGADESEVKIELDKLSSSVKLYLSKQFPDCTSVEFNVTQPVFEDLLKNFNTRVNDGVETKAEDKGDGMQRALMLAIIQTYADFRKEHEESNKIFLFFIDEGELHLHPSAQRNLKNALLDLSNRGDQVFINTHSSVLVSDDHAEQKIFKVEKQNKISEIKQIEKNEKPYIIYELLGGSPADLLLPRNFLLVEGKSDYEFILKILQRFYPEKIGDFQIIFVEGDFQKQKTSMDRINQCFAPLSKTIYKDKLIILCDKPGDNRQKDFDNFCTSYSFLKTNNQLFVLPTNSLEEYYPAPWKKDTSQIKTLDSNGGKVPLAREVSQTITKDIFEKDMLVIFDAINKCSEKAFN